MVYYSHHDMMRLFLLSMRRAGIVIDKTKSGNPKIYFSPATSIGVKSRAEFVEIDTLFTAHKLAEILKTYLPEGLKIEAEYDTKSRLNISKRACLAKYEISLPNIDGIQKKITDLITDENFKIVLKMNNEVRDVYVKNSIHNFYFEKGKLYLIAKIGKENLNISALIQQIFEKLKIYEYNVDVLKTNLFIKVEDRYHDVELVTLRNSN